MSTTACEPANDSPSAQESAEASSLSASSPLGARPAPCTGTTSLTPGVPGSPGHLLESDINPNGQSELAWLMRRMQQDMLTARGRLTTRSEARLRADHQRIRCSWPTTSQDRRPPFDALAVAYLGRVEEFNLRPSRASFNAVVDGCLHCHDQLCDGPTLAIKNLRIAQTSSD